MGTIERIAMGKRKSRKAPPKRAMNKKLSTMFDCPFCNHEKAVDVQISKKEQSAVLRCDKCSERYETTANYLTEPIDVYAEWLDAIAAANDKQAAGGAAADYDQYEEA